MKKALQYIFAFYLFAYFADGLLSVLDEIMELIYPLSFLNTLRANVASYVILGALFCYLLLAITNLFRRSLYVGIILFPIVYVVIVSPLMVCLCRDMSFTERIILEGPDLLDRSPETIIFSLFLSAFQLITGMYACWRWYRELQDDAAREDNSDDVGFSGKFLAGFLVSNIVLTIILVPSITLFYIVFTIDALGRDFVHMDTRGLSVVQRELKKGDTTVLLVPMVHIGRRGFYDQLSKDVLGDDTLILFEGISDRKRRIQTAGAKTKLAKLVGLSDQPAHFNPLSIKRAKETTSVDTSGNDRTNDEKSTSLPDLMRADLDTSEFAPETIEFINCSEKLIKKFDPAFASRYFTLINDKTKMRKVLTDIIDKRNDRLVQCVLGQTGRYGRIIVPWGVFHLHDVEQKLLKKGYKQGETKMRLVITLGNNG